MAYARRHGITTFEELSKATGCGTGCGSCKPYLEELLRSGKLRCGDQLFDLPNAAPPVADGSSSPLQEPVEQGDQQQNHDGGKEERAI